MVMATAMSFYNELYVRERKLVAENTPVILKRLPQNIAFFGELGARMACSSCPAICEPYSDDEMEGRTEVAEEEGWTVAGKMSQRFLPLTFVSVAKAQMLSSVRSKLPIQVFVAEGEAGCLEIARKVTV